MARLRRSLYLLHVDFLLLELELISQFFVFRLPPTPIGSYSLCSCRFCMFIGGGEFRILSHRHLDLKLIRLLIYLSIDSLLKACQEFAFEIASRVEWLACS